MLTPLSQAQEEVVSQDLSDTFIGCWSATFMLWLLGSLEMMKKMYKK